MGSIFAEMGGVVSALTSGDPWMMKPALNTAGAWPVGLIVLLVGAGLTLAVYRLVPFVERHLERSIMVWTYLAIGGIIFVEVFRRFVFSVQSPWSTTLPPYLFLVMTWFGCAYNVKLRTHLSFSEFRTMLPPFGQFVSLCVDALLWLIFCWVVVVTGGRMVVNSAANFQFMAGTDDVMQWWFLITLPIAFILLAARVIENFMTDLANFRADRPLIAQSVIGGE